MRPLDAEELAMLRELAGRPGRRFLHGDTERSVLYRLRARGCVTSRDDGRVIAYSINTLGRLALRVAAATQAVPL